MRIAVTYDNENIYGHFGHTEFFKIYEIQDNKIISTQVVSTNGEGHGALAGFLVNNKVDGLICGGIGPGALKALSFRGIKIYAGVEGSCDLAVNQLLNNKLEYSTAANCDHSGHDHSPHDHSGGCGSHGCH